MSVEHDDVQEPGIFSSEATDVGRGQEAGGRAGEEAEM